MLNSISIKKRINNNTVEWLIVLLCQLIFIGLVSSRALVSIGMIALIILPILVYGLKNTWQSYVQQKNLLTISLFFWIVFISGLYSSDTTNWLQWVQIKLPFLFLPIAFAPIKKLYEQKFITLLYGFILVLIVSSVAVLFRYFSNYDFINHSFLTSNGIKMPFSHIRYTLMLAFAFFCTLFLFSNKLFLVSKFEKWVQVFVLFFLFTTIHILAVRSALLALYIGLFYFIIQYIICNKKYVVGTLFLILFSISPFVAYKYIPSFKNKLTYMQYDLEQLSKGELNYRYDAMRITSMKTALLVWQNNKWIGTGAGDLKAEMNNAYQTHYPQLNIENRLQPHSQLLWTLACTGLLGFLLFLVAFFYPITSYGLYKNWLVVVFSLLIFSSLFTEATFEEQMGTGFYLLFLLLLTNFFKPNG